jgi:hypothetical protein
VAHPVGAHALAAGIVDRRRNAFQLPGNYQRHADGHRATQKKTNSMPTILRDSLPGKHQTSSISELMSQP